MSITALLLILASAFLHAGWNFLNKRSYPTTEVYLIALTAGMIVLLPVAAIYLENLSKVPGDVWILVSAAGLFQALYFSGLGGAYRSGDLSIAYPAARSLPVLIVLLVSLILGRGEAISLQAIAGFFIVVVSAFFLPMRTWGELRLRNYVNRMTAFALLAAVGTAGYSMLDDEALRVMRATGALRSGMSVTEISFLYLSFEAVTTVVWMVIIFGIVRGTRGVQTVQTGISMPEKKEKPGRRVLQPVLTGVMIYVTYGMVLGLVLLKERGGWVRLTSVAFMVAGLVLVATG
jgi:drug/metabolite transporter (DMT)-like permease